MEQSVIFQELHWIKSMENENMNFNYYKIITLKHIV